MTGQAARWRLKAALLGCVLLSSCAGLDQPRGAGAPSRPLSPSQRPQSNGLIAFTGGNGGYSIDVLDLDRPGWRDLTHPSGGEMDLSPRWSPDGARIAFMRYTNLDEEGNGDYELFITDSDGTGVRNLTEDRGVGDPPSWAPDGRRIAYACYGGEDHTDVCVVDVENGAIRRITSDPAHEYGIDWSPDGSRIAFQRGVGGGNFDIFTIAPDGSDPIQVTATPDWDGTPSWSPDGSQIAFVRYEDREGEIYLVDRDGTGLTKLTDAPGSVSALAWSPGGDRIAFQAFRDHSWDILVTGTVGKGLQVIASGPTDEVGPTWSPDGSRLVFSATRLGSEDGDNAGSFDLFLYRFDGEPAVQLTRDASELAGDLSWQPVLQQAARSSSP